MEYSRCVTNFAQHPSPHDTITPTPISSQHAGTPLYSVLKQLLPKSTYILVSLSGDFCTSREFILNIPLTTCP